MAQIRDDLHNGTANFDNIVLVGACAIDTILSVPHYPTEDSKLRATSITTRRGGNTANTAEVLQQLLNSSNPPSRIKIHLINVFPSQRSAAFRTITKSLDWQISTAHSIFRESHIDAISSYVVRSAAADSRTIVTHNPLPEMSVAEFKAAADALVRDVPEATRRRTWFHFEGRVPETTRECMKYVKELWLRQQVQSVISVEVEKPGRAGLQELALLADVVFYSKDWMLAKGYPDAHAGLLDQARQKGRLGFLALICTWGAQGSYALAATDQIVPHNEFCSRTDELVVIHGGPEKVDKEKRVDPVGAGDTFIAAILHILNSPFWMRTPTVKKLRFANQCAARKIQQEGFKGLVEWMWAEQQEDEAADNKGEEESG